MIKLLVLWVLLPQPSYSFDYTYGYTANAALLGSSWDMSSDVLGVNIQDGLDVSGVIYQYTPVKEVDDDFVVTVQNERVGGGYIFQDTQDWSGGPGVTIQRVVPLPFTPIKQFGKGSIATTGTGTVEDATVLYMYRFNPCQNPQNDPGCPGYVPPLPVVPKIEIYDALTDESVSTATKKTDKELYEDEQKIKEDEEEQESKERLQIALGASKNALTISNKFTQSAIVNAMNIATNISSYYSAQIPTQVYRTTIVLNDTFLPDNRKALRSLAQDKLHNTMLEEQYK